MENLLPKAKTNLNLYILLTICSVLIAAPTEAFGNTIDSHQEILNTSASIPKSLDQDSILLSQRNSQRAELNAFFRSEYNYCDAQLLSEFWGQSLPETKARIGRKVLWGNGGIPYLEQYLVDARFQAIQQNSQPCTYREAGYTYDDAVLLANFWGDPSPWEAKQRIERNLLLGKQKTIDSALRRAGR